MNPTFTQACKINDDLNGQHGGSYSEGFADFVAMRVLGAKRIQRFGSPYGANALPMGMAQRKELVRNLGIRIDAIQLAELDALTEMLGCNKQEFVLEVLSAGIAQARQALAGAGLREAFDEILDRKVEAAGFTMEPSPTPGYWATHHRGELVVNRHFERHRSAASAMSDTVAADTVGEGSVPASG